MMVNSFEMEVKLINEAIERWADGMRKQQKKDSEARKASEALRRIPMKYKRIDGAGEYILNSVYTYSSIGVLSR